MRGFAGDTPMLRQVKISRHWQLDMPETGARRLAELDDGSPAIVSAPHGRGRVLITAFPADDEWTTWPADPSYLVAWQEILRHLARPVDDNRNTRTGDTFHTRIDPGRFDDRVTVTAPDNDRSAIRALPESDAGTLRLTIPRVRRPGLWHIELTPHDGPPEALILAANLAPDAGATTRLRAATVAETTPDGADVRVIENAELAETVAAAARAELSRWIGLLLLAVLFTEQLLAWKFGQRREQQQDSAARG